MGMTSKDLEFQCAFAEVYKLQNATHQECLDKISEWFVNFHEANESYFSADDIIDDFLKYYNAVKEYGLMAEIQMSMESGYDFFMACWDWDIRFEE